MLKHNVIYIFQLFQHYKVLDFSRTIYLFFQIIITENSDYFPKQF
jgi:hypothetical protein